MAVDWKNVGLPRWYDCKLGRLKDQALARLVGTTKGRIRARRLALGIAACSVNQVIEPFRHLLGCTSTGHMLYPLRLTTVSRGLTYKNLRFCGIPIYEIK